MKTTLLAAAMAATLLTTPGAEAQQRVSTTNMTCRQAQAYLAQRGAAVIGTGGYTYDRYVVSRAYCEQQEVTKTSFVPTRDTPQCFIGYRCVESSPDDWLGDN